MEKSIAEHDESHESMMVNEADMDLRIPGLPHAVAKLAQSTSVRQLIQKIENHPDWHALQQDLRQNQTIDPLSRIKTNDLGCWEHRIMRITQTEPKTQCTVCLSYWNIGILYCTCVHFLHKERGANQQFINYTHGPSFSSRVRHQIDLVKSRETRNTIRLTSWRKYARHSISKESMIDSHEIQNSVIDWLKIIETKNFVDDGVPLRLKIVSTIWLHKNTLSMKVTGGFIRTSKVPRLCQWRTDLTSNRQLSTLHN